MNILLAYATNSGGTQAAAQTVTDALSAKGHTVTVKLARETTADDFTNAGAIILASPTWDYEAKEGMPHEDYVGLMKNMEGKTFEGKPFAILVLGDSSYLHFCGAADHLEEWVKTLKGNRIIDSMRIDGFYQKQQEHTEAIKAWAEKLATALPH